MSGALIEAVEPREAVRGRIHAEDFETIVREHQKRIYRILYLMLRDADEADGLTQECFLRAFARRAAFRGEASMGTWLVRIAINLAQDQRRSRRTSFWKRLLHGRRHEDKAQQGVNPCGTPEDAILAKEKVAAIWTAAENLPMRQRTAFLLRYGEDMTLQEIAVAMKLREGTVKAHLAGATYAVRRELERRR